MSPTSGDVNSFFDIVDISRKGWVSREAMRNALLHLNWKRTNDAEEKCAENARERDAGVQIAVDRFIEPFASRIWREDFVRALSDGPKDGEHIKPLEAPILRRTQAVLSLYGPLLLVVVLILMIQIGCAAWQALGILKVDNAYEVFGYGVIVAKAFAGALYPTVAILLMSSSRRAQTLLRHTSVVKRLPLWDLGNFIHAWMASSALCFGTCHAFAHILGTFRHGSRVLSQQPVPTILGGQVWSYSQFICCVSGATGMALLLFFWTVALTALPAVRKNHFQMFRWAHRLVLPIIALLCVHGSSSILQRPVMGYWIALPTIIVLYEKLRRFKDACMSVPATLEVIGDTVRVTSFQLPDQSWRIVPGQYAQLQVPSVSRIQWHPFTISGCTDGSVQMHIKCVGPWTRALRDSATQNKVQTVRLSGPFGAPAQRYPCYKHSIMIGCGIGITPAHAVIRSITKAMGMLPLPSARADKYSSTTALRNNSSENASVSSISMNHTTSSAASLRHEHTQFLLAQPPPMLSTFNSSEDLVQSTLDLPASKERVAEVPATGNIQGIDFHFIVRRWQDLTPFTDLLELIEKPNLQMTVCGSLRVQKGLSIHVTGAQNCHEKVLRRIEQQRTAVARLRPDMHYHERQGRPDLESILRRHFIELVERNVDAGDVGIFVSGPLVTERSRCIAKKHQYCGPKAACRNLSSCCTELTARAMHLNLRIRYVLWAEQF